MSEDLIRRSDAINLCEKWRNRTNEHHDKDGWYIAVTLLNAIKELPSADRPQGEWIDMGDFEQCSVCKGTRLKEFQSYYGKVTWIKTPYCPSCGAQMKGADDDSDNI